MKRWRGTVLPLLLLAGGPLGCSVYSLVDAADPTQEITITSNPPEAHCFLFREGEVIAEINPTPGDLQVDRTKHDMSVVCKKYGYHDGTEILKSGIAATPFWDVIELNASGFLVNALSGANNSYPGTTTVNLIPGNVPVIAIPEEVGPDPANIK